MPTYNQKSTISKIYVCSKDMTFYQVQLFHSVNYVNISQT